MQLIFSRFGQTKRVLARKTFVDVFRFNDFKFFNLFFRPIPPLSKVLTLRVLSELFTSLYLIRERKKMMKRWCREKSRIRKRSPKESRKKNNSVRKWTKLFGRKLCIVAFLFDFWLRAGGRTCNIKWKLRKVKKNNGINTCFFFDFLLLRGKSLPMKCDYRGGTDSKRTVEAANVRILVIKRGMEKCNEYAKGSRFAFALPIHASTFLTNPVHRQLSDWIK